MANHGNKVVPFLPTLRYCVAASEEMGRPVVELKEEHFRDFYSDALAASSSGPGESPAKKRPRDDAAEKKSRKKGRDGKRRGGKLPAVHVEQAQDPEDALIKELVKETTLARERFTALAKWLGELLVEKRNKVSLAQGGGPSAENE